MKKSSNITDTVDTHNLEQISNQLDIDLDTHLKQ